jgi:hypothetical protein
MAAGSYGKPRIRERGFPALFSWVVVLVLVVALFEL